MKKKTSSTHLDKAEFEVLIAAMEQETAALRRDIRRVRGILLEVDVGGDQPTSLSMPCPKGSIETIGSKTILAT
ncbi:MAG: hypothetical protein U0176_18840 [Bacteroidia bacterium]